MAQEPCDCSRVPAGLALDCQIINDAWRLLGGEDAPGPATPPPPQAVQSAPQLPQPLRIELIDSCRVEEDPDRRPLYLWDCYD